MLKKKWLVIVSWNTRRRELSTRWPESKLKRNKTRLWVYNKIVKGCAEAKSASEFKKGWGEFMENISVGTQGFEWNSHIRQFWNSCLLEVEKTYQEKVQPSQYPGCAHVPLLLAIVESCAGWMATGCTCSMDQMSRQRKTSEVLKEKKTIWKDGLGIIRTCLLFTWVCWVVPNFNSFFCSCVTLSWSECLCLGREWARWTRGPCQPQPVCHSVK